MTAARSAASSAAPGRLSFVVTPAGSVIVRFARTCPWIGTRRAATPRAAQRRVERVVVASGRTAIGVDAGGRDHARDVDALAAGILPRRRRGLHLARLAAARRA